MNIKRALLPWVYLAGRPLSTTHFQLPVQALWQDKNPLFSRRGYPCRNTNKPTSMTTRVEAIAQNRSIFSYIFSFMESSIIKSPSNACSLYCLPNHQPLTTYSTGTKPWPTICCPSGLRTKSINCLEIFRGCSPVR
jgi:hypothetical protein